MSIIDKILRAGEGRTVKRLDKLAGQVDALDAGFSELTDEDLRDKTAEFKQRLADGETLDDILVEAFATVREAAWRVLRLKPFHVQVMGGIALHQGNIAEMATGEGKTLVATMPAYLRALTGKGVHVVTVNDYLAKYQSDLMGRVYRFLGLTCGCILVGQKPSERRRQYAADITYGTNNEFGFDYLRDNMAQRPKDMVQRGHNFVIIDEIDSILIDEARTPLIISGPSSGDLNHWYKEFARIAKVLEPGEDYEVDEKKRTVGILEPGIDKVEDQLGVENLYEAANTPLIGFLNNAIRAKELFHRNKDYIVQNGEVLIVDEHTGRVLPGRRYNEGMHQAIEAKERVEIKAENQTLATITLQNYFRWYPEGARCGMTGTAETEAAEFYSTYKMGVIPIPPNKPLARIDQPDLVYPTLQGKLKAVIEDIRERHEVGQPVLVGTASVESSEMISQLLKRVHIPHQVLNAKQHEREAQVVAMAGRKGAVTVATNMAGRGTDIMLGGNSEFIAQANLKDLGLDPVDTPDEYQEAWPRALEEARQSCAAEHEEVVQLGGLYVLGTERHESRRIDNQLRGRSGRQGDPGESRFYLSMEDDLMRLFNTGMAQRIMQSRAFPEDTPLESKAITSSIASAQRQVEARNYDIRKNVLKYDDVMTGQRELIYEQRQRVLHGEDLSEQIAYFMEFLVDDLVGECTAEGLPEQWDLEKLWSEMRGYYPVGITVNEVVAAHGGSRAVSAADVEFELLGDLRAAYDDMVSQLSENVVAKEQLGEPPIQELERRVLLATVDRLWREHLYEMDYLKEGIGLRAMGQRDPLVEYKDEGAHMFQAMMDRIREETVQQMFAYGNQFKKLDEQRQKIESQKASQQVAPGVKGASANTSQAAGRGARSRLTVKIGDGSPRHLVTSGPSEGGGTQVQRSVGGQNMRPRAVRPNTARMIQTGGQLGANAPTRQFGAGGSGTGANPGSTPAGQPPALNRAQRRAAAKRSKRQ